MTWTRLFLVIICDLAILDVAVAVLVVVLVAEVVAEFAAGDLAFARSPASSLVLGEQGPRRSLRLVVADE